VGLQKAFRFLNLCLIRKVNNGYLSFLAQPKSPTLHTDLTNLPLASVLHRASDHQTVSSAFWTAILRLGFFLGYRIRFVMRLPHAHQSPI
jgi:hypothetical protein